MHVYNYYLPTKAESFRSGRNAAMCCENSNGENSNVFVIIIILPDMGHKIRPHHIYCTVHALKTTFQRVPRIGFADAAVLTLVLMHNRYSLHEHHIVHFMTVSCRKIVNC